MSGLLIGCCCACNCPSGTNCTHCSGITPTQWHLSVVGTEGNAPCQTTSAFPPPGSSRQGTGANIDGTYTITQFAACQWQNATYDGPAFLFYSTTDCTGASTSKAYLNSEGRPMTGRLQFSGSTAQVDFFATQVVGYPPSKYFLGTLSTADPDDCCATYTFTNSYTSYYGTDNAGTINGTVVATPC